MRRVCRLYFMYIGAAVRSLMQYKASLALMIFGRFILTFNGLLGISFLFAQFHSVKDYGYGDILLCFAVMQMAFSLAECVARGFGSFSGMVKRGEFDRVLLRPCSPILQVLGGKFELGQIGVMVSGLITLALGISKSEVAWSAWRICTLVFMVLGGALLFACLFMIGATICFFAVEESGSINILTYGAKEHGKYPIDVYGKGIMQLCTYLIPYTLVQYYPLQYLLGRTDRWFYGLYPFGTLLFLAVCYAFWRFGVRHYKSSGS